MTSVQDNKPAEKLDNGVLILGNSGSGKSFLANIFLGRERFKQLCSAESITHQTEFEIFKYKDIAFSIFNIPGLIEDDQDAIDRNKQEIHKAFDMCVNTYIIFVFNGGSAGRIRNEDIVAFNAINKAYEFDTKSLMLVVNDLPPDRPEDYNDLTGLRLQSILKLKERPMIVFLDRIDKTSDDLKKELLMRLVVGVEKLIKASHKRKCEIELDKDIIKKMVKQLREQQIAFDKKLKAFEEYKKPNALRPNDGPKQSSSNVTQATGSSGRNDEKNDMADLQGPVTDVKSEGILSKNQALHVSEDAGYGKWQQFEETLQMLVEENRINKEMAARLDDLAQHGDPSCNIQ